jgi:hypothetical protein
VTRAAAGQRGQAAQGGERNATMAGQHEIAIALARWQGDAAPAHARGFQELGVADVEVIAFRQRRLIRADAGGRVVALEVQNVRDMLAGLQQRLAARRVGKPLLCAVLPPGIATVEMNSVEAAGEAGAEMFADERLLRADMDAVLVDAAAVDEVAERLERERMLVPAHGRGLGGERLRAHNLHALHASGHHGLEPQLRALLFALDPDFGHGMVSAETHLQLLEGTAVGLGRKADSVFVATLGEAAVIVVGEEIANGAAHVPKELLGRVETLHYATCKRGDVGGEIVVSPFAEVAGETSRPVLPA